MLPEEQTIDQLASQVDFPPLKVVRFSYGPNMTFPALPDYKGGMGSRPDLMLEFEWQGERRLFIVELKRRSTPSDLENTIQQLKRYRELIRNYWPSGETEMMLMVPYLSPEALDRLSAEGISGIDLSGNGVVTIPGKWFVYRTGRENRFPSSAPIKNVFTGNSSLAVRVFLLRQTFSSVSEVHEELKRRGGSINLSTVSKVLKRLQEELIVTRGETIRLANAGRLLDQLVKNFRDPIARRRLKIKVPSFDKALSLFKRNADREGIMLVGNSPSRYVVMPSVEALRVYTSSYDQLVRGVEYAETSRFPSFELVETSDKTVYFDRREETDFYWTSPIQVYLELAGGGKREQETAEELREDLLSFKFGGGE